VSLYYEERGTGSPILPAAFRAVDVALARMIPGARHEVVGGGHLVNPANPVVPDFIAELNSDSR
jgi:hypothetical protein